MMANFIKTLLIPTTFLLALTALGQVKTKSEFITYFKEYLSNEYKVSYIPNEFYECGYEMWVADGEDTFDFGYSIVQRCLPGFVDQIRFSDKGVKLLAGFEDAFVNVCSRKIKDYEPVLYTGRYCKCLHEQYVKYKIGFDDLSEAQVEDSEFYQKIFQYCFKINEK